MISYDHPLKSVLFQDRNIFLQADLAVNGALFHMAMHINLHTLAPFSSSLF